MTEPYVVTSARNAARADEDAQIKAAATAELAAATALEELHQVGGERSADSADQIDVLRDVLAVSTATLDELTASGSWRTAESVRKHRALAKMEAAARAVEATMPVFR